MHDNLISTFYNVSKRITPGSENKAIFGFVGEAELSSWDQTFCGHPAGIFCQFFTELVTVADGQFPRKFIGEAVAIGAFDFHLGEGCTMDVAIAMHIN